MDQQITLHDKTYRVLRLLGHGKGGYSYLVENDGNLFVLKQIHHEPCSYYTFGNKIEAEYHDYHRLLQAGIRIPKMLDIDKEQEIILKEYIEGDTIFDMVKNDIPVDEYIPQVEAMASLAKAAGLNIDYYPTNFVVHDRLIYYIDYECNAYDPQWDFTHWGKQYWSKTPAFLAQLQK